MTAGEFFQALLFQPEMAFLRNALWMAALSRVAVGVVGTMVVTRRIASLGGAISHVALGGVGAALFLQRVCAFYWCSATLGAVAGALFAALVVGIVSMYAKEREDTIINAVWALGMSVGLLFLDRTPGTIEWQSYLFGSILLLTEADLWMVTVLDVVVLVPTLLFYNNLLAMSFDGTFAELRGVKVRLIYPALLALTALTIVLLINVVGIILVIALLTLPAATAGCYTRHLWSMMLLSGILNWIFVTAGLLASFWLRVSSGPAIVVLAGSAYIISLALSARLGKRN